MKKVLLFIVVIGLIFWGIQSFNNTAPVPDPVTTPAVDAEPITEPEKIVNPYFSFRPPVQDSISSTRDENNLVLWKHLDNSSNAFYIDDYDYVKVFLNAPLACNRDMLIGINGKSMGVIHKNNNCNFVSNVVY
jgi:hypothetical protein